MGGRLLVLALSAGALTAGCGSSTATSTQSQRTTAPHTITTSAPTTQAAPPPTRPHHRPRPRPALGSLPQTRQRPSAASPTFRREMRALWRGVRRNSVRAALPAFFPVRAYVQVKAIGDARGDWTNRLLEDYRLDLAAAHALLGGNARLREVQVPSTYAHWVPPGACYNRVGYWEVPNARLVYRDHAGLHSFGIASMISWRGVWYVVHLGAVLRPSARGVVDSPSAGQGVSAYSGTC